MSAGTDIELYSHDDVYMEVVGYTLPPKDSPEQAQLLDGSCYQYHQDGPFFEFAPETLFDSGTELVNHISMIREQLEQMYDISLVGVWGIDVPPPYSGMPNIMVMGCAEDYEAHPSDNLYRKRRVPRNVGESTYREAGMHLHIDLPKYVLTEPGLVAQYVRELDNEVYPLMQASIAMPDVLSWYRQRRVFRPKAYGIEYRSLSSELVNHPQLLSDVVDIALEMAARW